MLHESFEEKSDVLIERPKLRPEAASFPCTKKIKIMDIEEIDFGMIQKLGSKEPLFSPSQILRSHSQDFNSPRCKAFSAQLPCSGSGSRDSLRDGFMRDDSYRQYPITKITDTIYLGSDDDANNLDLLRREKITHCLSLVARKWKKNRGLSSFRWGKKEFK